MTFLIGFTFGIVVTVLAYWCGRWYADWRDGNA